MRRSITTKSTYNRALLGRIAVIIYTRAQTAILSESKIDSDKKNVLVVIVVISFIS